ncbi:ATP-dependent RNA helicase DDX43 [Nephila pilipes]|uniref:ATP-dependent RNA helicase DDX43 n=1 Tax=Nephila pilipes TaxID=299642 RepID=A0A8X6TVC2_NEPPI|nr:ATP-dependent RNA helicase DDX43 [Nephila pilipes]
MSYLDEFLEEHFLDESWNNRNKIRNLDKNQYSTNTNRDDRPRNGDRIISNQGSKTSRGSRNDRYGRSNEESSEMQIDSNYVSRVIGRGGSKIQELQDESGARIRILNENCTDGHTAFRLIGSANARGKAKILIENFIAKFSKVSINKSSDAMASQFKGRRQRKLAEEAVADGGRRGRERKNLFY